MTTAYREGIDSAGFCWDMEATFIDNWFASSSASFLWKEVSN